MIRYTAGYKYQLLDSYMINVPIKIAERMESGFLTLEPLRLDPNRSLLSIKEGYAWDGPSGLTIDTHNFMRGSLVHDALYQLMRWELLDRRHREAVDQMLKGICLKDGMSRLRAWWIYKAVRWGADRAASWGARKTVYES